MSRVKIGRVLSVHAFFNIKTDPSDWQNWKAGIEHAAGALRDVGIYSVATAMIGFSDYPPKYIFQCSYKWRSGYKLRFDAAI